MFIGRTDVEPETTILWPPDAKSWPLFKRPWCWERLKAGREGNNRGYDGLMASPTQWTWVWVNFGSWWWIGKPGMLQSTGSQRVRHACATQPNWTYNNWLCFVGTKTKQQQKSILCTLVIIFIILITGMYIFHIYVIFKESWVVLSYIGLPWWLRWWRIHLLFGRLRFDPLTRKIPWRKKWQPYILFCLKNPMDRGAWHATVHGVAKSQTGLSD